MHIFAAMDQSQSRDVRAIQLHISHIVLRQFDDGLNCINSGTDKTLLPIGFNRIGAMAPDQVQVLHQVILRQYHVVQIWRSARDSIQVA